MFPRFSLYFFLVQYNIHSVLQLEEFERSADIRLHSRLAEMEAAQLRTAEETRGMYANTLFICKISIL